LINHLKDRFEVGGLPQKGSVYPENPDSIYLAGRFIENSLAEDAAFLYFAA